MEEVLTVITLATAVKGMVELAEKIHASFEKVSDNLRHAQALASEMKETIDRLKMFCEQHSATLENDQDLRDTLLAVIVKLKKFDSEIVPLIASPGRSVQLHRRVRDRFKARRNGGRVEASIRLLKEEVKKCERKFVMMSVARMQVKLNELQGSTSEGLQLIQQLGVSDLLFLRNTGSFASHSLPSSKQRLTPDHWQRIVPFAQTLSLTSTPIWKTPSGMQEQIIQGVYLKRQIHHIAKLLGDLSTHVTTYSIEPLRRYTNPFTNVVGKEQWLAYRNQERIHRDVVIQALQIREILNGVSVGTSIQEGAWHLNNLAIGLYDLEMYKDAVMIDKWAVSLFQILANVHEAIYSPYLVRSLQNLSRSHVGAGNNNDALDAIQEAARISEGLQTPIAPLEIRVQHGSVLSLYALRMSSIKKDHKRAIKLAEQSVELMEDINSVDSLPQSYDKVNGMVQVSHQFLTQLYQVSPSETALAEYTRALRTLSNCLMADNQRQESLDTKLRALPIFYDMVSLLAVDTDDELAEILHELINHKYNFLLPAEKALEYAEHCVRIYCRYAELNPSKYSQSLRKALYKKGLVLNRLGHDSKVLETWKEVATISQQMIEGREHCFETLDQLRQSFHRLKRHEEVMSFQTQSPLIHESSGHKPKTSVATKKNSNIMPVAPQDDEEPFSSKYGGLDDSEEREHVPKGDHCATQSQIAESQTIAKIKHNAPHVKFEPGLHRCRHCTSDEKADTGKRGFTHSDLPLGSLRKWQGLLLPAWKDFLASVENVWDTSDDQLHKELQTLWGLVFPRSELIVKTDEAVYWLAKQCLYEWRGGFASTAYHLVKTYFEEYSKDAKACEAHAQWLLDVSLQSPFLWKDVEMGKNTKPKGLFRSGFILQTLSYHQSLVRGLPEDLEVSDMPRSALALSVVAVKRAIGFWVTGRNTFKDPDTNHTFSEANHGNNTMEYIQSIASLSNRAWVKILEEANTFVIKTRQVHSSDSADPSTTSHRANLFESDSD